MRKSCKQLSLLVLAILVVAISNASSMTIKTRFVGGTAPENAVGGGNLTDIVNTAARMWESVYSDDVTVTLNYGWASVGDAGIHMAVEMTENRNREISGTILFNNTGSTQFYLDPTPRANEEYLQRNDEYQNFGGGSLNVARIFRQPVGDAVGHVDLLSVALHEIGHAMGLSLANQSFVTQSSTGVIRLSSGLPYAGTLAPMASNNSGIIPHFDVTQVAYGCLMGGINSDERRIPSELDILTNAQISGYSIFSLTPTSEPQSVSPVTPRGSSTIHKAGKTAAIQRRPVFIKKSSMAGIKLSVRIGK